MVAAAKQSEDRHIHNIIGWETVELREIAKKFIVPMRDKPKKFSGNIPWCRIDDFNGKYLSDSKHNRYVDRDTIELMNLKIHPRETLLISCSADLGKCAIVKEPLVTNQTFIGIFFDDTRADNEFLYYYMTAHAQELNDLSSGTTISYLSREQFECFKVEIPTNVKEQSAIAQALSDADDLILELDRLIAKKRDVKQGAMQELLTGKRRLPGFEGEWEARKLGDVLGYEQPVKYIVKTSEYNDSYNTPVLTANKGFILGYTDETDGIYEKVPVIIFDDFTLDNKYVPFPFKVKSSAIKMLRIQDGVSNLRYVFERMQLICHPIGDHKRYYISEYQHIELKMPSPEEQTAIAQVLSDMDTEIGELEDQREKYVQLKQGMMQELLTGRIRLR